MIRLLSLTALPLAMFGAWAAPLAAESYDCLMDPSEAIELASPVAGMLEAVTVDLGDRVTKGQEVAQLISAVEESTVEILELRANSTGVVDAQARQVDMMERRYARVVSLFERGITTQEALDQIESELISAQSLLLQAELNRDLALKELARAKISLGQRTIYSPIDGLVRERVLVGGEYVDADDHILKLVRLDPLRIEAFLPVSLYGKVGVGDHALVHPAEPLHGEYNAVVISVDPVFDAASATFVLVLELPNPDGTLPAGHRCRLELVKG
ncbi:RND family efflux transporter, MFP subunit [Roseovarius marisflavi]|uniref:RND family efflux transporter, MFP subunit n=1 Tax=Roseovarius marisflavi TaxID=1054996 RepID=A0A1M7CN94_9RHOB|nr:efflux RND transporter periplasmic adaptor subunit [Roseovarius marisflavi]SHL68736.1 RND family efflux transporter, MFP subunit [Roseovarius marisflavi]